MISLRIYRASIRPSGQYSRFLPNSRPGQQQSCLTAPAEFTLASPSPTTLASRRPSSTSTTTPAPGLVLSSINTHKISARSTQIARHFSSSPSNTSNTASPPTEGSVNLHTNMASKFTVRKIGAPNTLEHRIFIEKDGIPVSPFHDIPLYANEQQTILNMVVEIPRWTNAKLEASLSPFLLFPQLNNSSLP